VRFFEVPSQAESEWFEIDLQAGFTLQGTVSEEETGRGLPDLVVVVQHAQEGVFSSVTDDEGGFVVAGIPEGSISVQVDGDPYCEGDPYWSMAQAPLEAAGDVSDQLEWHPTMRRVVPQVPGMDTGTEAQACGCASAAGVPIGWGLWLMALVGFRRAGQRPDRQGRTRG
jgi:hypothetical protein